MLRDPRLDAIADAHRERTGAEAVLLAALLLAEESGEAVQQTRRFMGRARSAATAADVGAELADVVVSAAVLARLLDVDLGQAVDEQAEPRHPLTRPRRATRTRPLSRPEASVTDQAKRSHRSCAV